MESHRRYSVLENADLIEHWRSVLTTYLVDFPVKPKTAPATSTLTGVNPVQPSVRPTNASLSSSQKTAIELANASFERFKNLRTQLAAAKPQTATFSKDVVDAYISLVNQTQSELDAVRVNLSKFTAIEAISENAKLRETITLLQSDIDKLVQQLNELNATVSQFQKESREIESYKQKIREYEQQVEELTTRLNTSEQNQSGTVTEPYTTNNELRAMIDEYKKRLQEMESNMEITKLKFEQNLNSSEQRVVAMEEAVKDLTKIQEEVVSLRDLNSTMRTNLEKRNASLKEVQKLYRNETTKNNTLTKNNQKLERSVTAKDEELKRQQENNKTLMMQYAEEKGAYEKRIRELQESVDKFLSVHETSIKDLSDNLKKQLEQNSNQQEELKTAIQKRDEMKRQVDELQLKYNEMQSQIQENAIAQATVQDEIEKTKTALDKAVNEYIEIVNDVKELQEIIIERDKTIEQLRAELVKLKAELDRVGQEQLTSSAVQNQELNQQRLKIETLESTNARLQQSLNESKDVAETDFIKQLQTQKTDIELQLQQAKDKEESLRIISNETREGYETKIKTLDEQIKLLQQNNDTIQEQLALAAKSRPVVVDESAELIEARRTIDELRKQLAGQNEVPLIDERWHFYAMQYDEEKSYSFVGPSIDPSSIQKTVEDWLVMGKTVMAVGMVITKTRDFDHLKLPVENRQYIYRKLREMPRDLMQTHKG